MAKRRRQQQARASEEALARRLDDRTAVDWRVWGIVGLAVVAILVAVVAVAIGASSGGGTVGQLMPDAGGSHIPEGTPGTGYTSNPPTSGQHWSSAIAPTRWGVHETPVRVEQAVHNLEHGGIAIWYQADQLSPDQIGQLQNWVRGQVRGERFKVLVSPWSGTDFDAPIAVTSWRYLLYLDSVDIGQIDSFLNAHYGRAPEPGGGPGRPA